MLCKTFIFISSLTRIFVDLFRFRLVIKLWVQRIFEQDVFAVLEEESILDTVHAFVATRCLHQADPEVNKFEQVFSLGDQMVRGMGGGLYSEVPCQVGDPSIVRSNASWVNGHIRLRWRAVISRPAVGNSDWQIFVYMSNETS